MVWILCFIFIKYRPFENPGGEGNFIVLVIMSVGILITTSGISFLPVIFQNIYNKHIGLICLSWYMTHRGWNYIVMYGFLGDHSPVVRLVVYMVLSFVTACVFVIITELLKKSISMFSKRIGNKICIK